MPGTFSLETAYKIATIKGVSKSKIKPIPPHLKRYVVKQDYNRYTAIDQATWRFILRQLQSHLVKHAHESYVTGLKKTGVTIEAIPKIENISKCISKFGWRAVPVSGFIPPAAFMEMQSLGYLPIAQDMRAIEHLMYTPAPDIVHEAAGHAPILANKEFAKYLQRYAQVAKKAIVSKEDLDQYEAIRILSDLKEDPRSTPEQVAQANAKLHEISKNMSHISEAALLARMNWWTAEYGLIGDIHNPRIYGAGLLSSAGESRSCLESSVQKIPFSIKCLEFSYDITEPQPQLFVTPSFQHLTQVLDEMAATMAFKLGGRQGLDKILLAQSVNTAELNSGVQISGVLTEYLRETEGVESAPIYLKFTGPCQLSFADHELPGHGTKRHPQGFGTPVGFVKGHTVCLSQWTPKQITQHLKENSSRLEFESGVVVHGQLKKILQKKGKVIVLTFKKCKVSYEGKTLFDPAWGEFDMAVGSEVTSAYGGPADREKFGQLSDFVAKKIPVRKLSPKQRKLNALYQLVREAREKKKKTDLLKVFNYLVNEHPEDWLLRLEILELALKRKDLGDLKEVVLRSLAHLAGNTPEAKAPILDGVALLGLKLPLFM